MLSDPKGNPACQRLLKLNYELKKENQVLKEKVSKLSEKTTHTISQHEKTIIQDDYSPNFLSYETFSSDIIHSDRDQSEEKLESYLKKLPLPCQSIDEYGKLIYVNPAWLNTLGYSWREVIGQYFGHFLHPESLKSFENECFSTQDTHIFRNLQFYIRQKNGRYISASFGGYVEYHEDGSFLRANCYFQDITKF
ncbi:MAG: PAS domain-containing protein, partial [Bacteroidota bacterium]